MAAKFEEPFGCLLGDAGAVGDGKAGAGARRGGVGCRGQQEAASCSWREGGLLLPLQEAKNGMERVSVHCKLCEFLIKNLGIHVN